MNAIVIFLRRPSARAFIVSFAAVIRVVTRHATLLPAFRDRSLFTAWGGGRRKLGEITSFLREQKGDQS